MTILQIKAAVRTRDGHRCTECGMTDEDSRKLYGCSLDVHRVSPGSAYAVDETCATLCKTCHGPQPKSPRGSGTRLSIMVKRTTLERIKWAAIDQGVKMGVIVNRLIETHLADSLATVREARRKRPLRA